MGGRLFAELKDLRALNEKRELERANLELQRRIQGRDLLFKEANHRLKNSLQIVSSMRAPRKIVLRALDEGASGSRRTGKCSFPAQASDPAWRPPEFSINAGQSGAFPRSAAS
jgi:hypothetical protein